MRCLSSPRSTCRSRCEPKPSRTNTLTLTPTFALRARSRECICVVQTNPPTTAAGGVDLCGCFGSEQAEELELTAKVMQLQQLAHISCQLTHAADCCFVMYCRTLVAARPRTLSSLLPAKPCHHLRRRLFSVGALLAVRLTNTCVHTRMPSAIDTYNPIRCSLALHRMAIGADRSMTLSGPVAGPAGGSRFVEYTRPGLSTHGNETHCIAKRCPALAVRPCFVLPWLKDERLTVPAGTASACDRYEAREGQLLAIRRDQLIDDQVRC